jgi:hypothetical protein
VGWVGSILIFFGLGCVELISCLVRGIELSQFTCLVQRQIDVG